MATYRKTSTQQKPKMSNIVLARAVVLQSGCIRSHLADTKVRERTRACGHEVAMLGTCEHTCAYAFVSAHKFSTASKNEQEPHVSTGKPVVVALPCAVTVRRYALANGRSCVATGTCQREQTCLLLPCGNMKTKHGATMCRKLLCTRVRPATHHMLAVCARTVWLKPQQQNLRRLVGHVSVELMASSVRDPPEPPLRSTTGQTEGGTGARRPRGATVVTHAKAKATRRRAIRPVIDLDDRIREAKAAAKAAAKSLAQARTQARVERKKRAHLIRKAGQLSAQDLERIAVLKRTGWWDPTSGEAVVPAISDEHAAEDDVGGTAASAARAATCGGGSASSASAGADGRGHPSDSVTSRPPKRRRKQTDESDVADVEDEDNVGTPGMELSAAFDEIPDAEQEPGIER